MFILEAGVVFSVPDLGLADPPEGLLANGFRRSDRIVLSNTVYSDSVSAPELLTPKERTLQRGLWELKDIGLAMFLASNLGSESVSFNLRYDNGRPMKMYQLLRLGAVVTRMSDEGEWQITLEELGSVALFIL
jgi:hypothetical protein